jgi:hypothetical protein
VLVSAPWSQEPKQTGLNSFSKRAGEVRNFENARFDRARSLPAEMLALGRLLAQAQGSQQDDHHYDSVVEALVQRVSESVILSDRREALLQLRDVLASAPRSHLAFGAMGFPVMAQIVREREDLEMVQAALECLSHAVGGAGEAAPATPGGAEAKARPGPGIPFICTPCAGGQRPGGDPARAPTACPAPHAGRRRVNQRGAAGPHARRDRPAAEHVGRRAGGRP